ncbi:hypothetical protein [Actinomadura parmotrematis]|uniref:DUF4034 domain-containing protein n=1 Tax=Actinomadura parmotrematis TaxID=2864039 RepID=A0ABS7G5D6_9ACTN|nr:hypothetical protein [Actinomadura parmotrematis]MBW8487440.1 hypothetical protein [Actinomadura parmotrematis]
MPVEHAPAEPALDPTFGDPDARRFQAALRAGDRGTVRDVLAAAGADGRPFLLRLVTELPGRPSWLDAWVDADGTADAHLARGAHGIGWAWAVRGTARAEHTSREQFQGFFERLRAAEADLEKAAELAPDDPEPWAQRVITARGLQLGHEELARRFTRVIERHPWHRRAHTQMVQGLAAKWSGSDELMLNFARERAAASPPGRAVAACVVEAHIEISLTLDDDDTARYFAAPAVLDELRAAAAHSVDHPSWPSEPDAVRADNLFAYAFTFAGDSAAAARRFEAIAGRVTEEPWNYVDDDAVKGFQRFEKRVARNVR